MKIKNILIGEDVRQEVGNKLSLMGILGESLAINLPDGAPQEVPVSLAFLVTVENMHPEQGMREFNVVAIAALGEKKLGKFSAQIVSSDSERLFHLPFPKIGFMLTESTQFTVQVQIEANGEILSEETTTLNMDILQD